MITNRRSFLYTTAAAATIFSPLVAKSQQKNEILLSRQPGILYLPSHIMEKRQLLEKHTARLGVRGVTTKWFTVNNSAAQIDQLLSDSIDIINTGTGPFMLLWDRTRGGVKGIVSTSAGPMHLITRDPRIQTLRDFGPGDKIALPTVKISTQAILLQIASGELFGQDQWGQLDPLTVQMGHPDAMIALTNPGHEIKSHFSSPPFQYYAIKTVPNARVIARSPEIIGEPLSQSQFITTTKFADANPVIIQAFRAAAEEAKKIIEAETNSAVEIYKEIANDKTPVNEILDILKEPGMMEWDIYPKGTIRFATHLNKIGTMKTLPKSFKDYYLTIAHDLPGT